MSNTPETDAFAIKFKTTCGEKYWVPVDIARKLERERDEARGKAERYRLEANAIMMQRDEARDAILGWENKWKCAVDMAARAELERDEAINKLKELKDILR